MTRGFYQSEFDQPHPARTRAIIKAHPEVRELMARNPCKVAIPIAILILQTSWTRLLFQFIVDKRYTFFSRVERMNQTENEPQATTAIDSACGLNLSTRPITF